MPDPGPDNSRVRQIMSLDFITFAAEASHVQRHPHGQPRPISSEAESHINLSGSKGDETGVADFATTNADVLQTDSPADPSNRSREPESQGRAASRPRYDDEEKFTILYLRLERSMKWLDVLTTFTQLFPPGFPRRLVGEALTKLYVERQRGGLECIYYRAREEYGFLAVRSSVLDQGDDKKRLAELQLKLKLDEEFLLRLKGF